MRESTKIALAPIGSIAAIMVSSGIIHAVIKDDNRIGSGLVLAGVFCYIAQYGLAHAAE